MSVMALSPPRQGLLAAVPRRTVIAGTGPASLFALTLAELAGATVQLDRTTWVPKIAGTTPGQVDEPWPSSPQWKLPGAEARSLLRHPLHPTSRDLTGSGAQAMTGAGPEARRSAMPWRPSA